MEELKKKSTSTSMEDETTPDNLFNLKVIIVIKKFQKRKSRFFLNLAIERWLCIYCG
jgi:hypothetical protein